MDWLKESSDNKLYFSHIRTIWLSQQKNSINQERYANDAFHLFEKQLQKKRMLKQTIRLNQFVKIAASVAILICCSISMFLLGKQTTHTAQETSLMVMNHVFIGNHSKDSVLLPDGSIVWLNANSKLSFPEHFSAENRTVKLEGEGYFEVKKNTESPFLVEMDNFTVKVLGTSFNIRNHKNDKQIETTLVTGKIEVSIPSINQKLQLDPNQQIKFNQEDCTYNINHVKASDCIVWTNDKLICTKEPLSDILDKMERWYGMNISCTPQVNLSQQLSLTIRKETPEEILKVLTLITPIKYMINDKKITIEPI